MYERRGREADQSISAGRGESAVSSSHTVTEANLHRVVWFGFWVNITHTFAHFAFCTQLSATVRQHSDLVTLTLID